MAREGCQAAVVIANPVSLAHRQEIIASAARFRVPTIYEAAIFARDGGLIAYGVEPLHLLRGAASYADKILKGASPSALPILQATKFELVVNLKTAKALGLAVPPALLAHTDEVIE